MPLILLAGDYSFYSASNAKMLALPGNKKQEKKPKTREHGDLYDEASKEDGSKKLVVIAAVTTSVVITLILGEFTKDIVIST